MTCHENMKLSAGLKTDRHARKTETAPATWVALLSLTLGAGVFAQESGRQAGSAAGAVLDYEVIDDGTARERSTGTQVHSGGRALYSDCNNNGVEDDEDIAGGTSVDENGNGLPDDCEVRKNRYLTFASAGTGPAVAFQVRMTESLYFPDSTGVLGWIGEPGDKNVARIVGDPFFSDSWPAYVFIGDCQVVPVASYEVLPTPDGISFGDATVIATIAELDYTWPRPWGDLVGDFNGIEWTPPNGLTTFVDIVAVVYAFQGRETMPHWTRADLDGEVPNAIINMSDVQRVILAFSGQSYPYSDPADCP